MKPEGKLLIRKKGGIFLYQNPSIAQCKSEKHADEYEVTDLNQKEDGKWKELVLQLVYFTYINLKQKVAVTIEAMKREWTKHVTGKSRIKNAT